MAVRIRISSFPVDVPNDIEASNYASPAAAVAAIASGFLAVTYTPVGAGSTTPVSAQINAAQIVQITQE